NSVGFEGEAMTKQVIEAITSELYQLDRFDDQFQAILNEARKEGGIDLTQRQDKWKREEVAIAGERKNLTAAIVQYGPRPMFEARLAELDARERMQARERQELDSL